jgi:hypothetical protein
MRGGGGAQLGLRRLRWPWCRRLMRAGEGVVSTPVEGLGPPRRRRIIPHRGPKRRAISQIINRAGRRIRGAPQLRNLRRQRIGRRAIRSNGRGTIIWRRDLPTLGRPTVRRASPARLMGARRGPAWALRGTWGHGSTSIAESRTRNRGCATIPVSRNCRPVTSSGCCSSCTG